MSNETYFNATKNAPASSLLKEAILLCEGNQALELGAGALSDSKFFLSKGFSVTAIDKSPLTISASKEITDKGFKFHQTTFDAFKYPIGVFNIVNAQWSLSFNPPQTFEKTFLNIKNSLKNNGIFCGQFFGNEDGWASKTNMTFFTKLQVEKLLEDMKIIKFYEERKTAKSVEGNIKFWHVFHVIAQKKDVTSV